MADGEEKIPAENAQPHAQTDAQTITKGDLEGLIKIVEQVLEKLTDKKAAMGDNDNNIPFTQQEVKDIITMINVTEETRPEGDEHSAEDTGARGRDAADRTVGSTLVDEKGGEDPDAQNQATRVDEQPETTPERPATTPERPTTEEKDTVEEEEKADQNVEHEAAVVQQESVDQNAQNQVTRVDVQPTREGDAAQQKTDGTERVDGQPPAVDSAVDPAAENAGTGKDEEPGTGGKKKKLKLKKRKKSNSRKRKNKKGTKKKY